MRPVLFTIPGLGIPIFSYGFMIMVGFLVAIFVASKRARTDGMDPNNILDLGIYLVVFGVLGARLFFIIQFRDKFGFQILNIFDSNLSIVGLILGLALGALAYFYRRKVQWFKRFHDNSANTRAFFAALAILAALILGRAMYVALTPSSTKIVAVVQDASDFYPDTLQREPLGPPTRKPSAKAEGQVIRVTGIVRAVEGSPGERKEQSYEFLAAHSPGERIGFTYEAAKSWLKQENIPYQELRPAYDLMLFEMWKGGLVYYGGVVGAIAAALLFAYRRKINFWHLSDLCAPSVALGLACGRIGCFLNGCCWGKVTQSWWGLTFPRFSPAYSQHLEMGRIVSGAQHSLAIIPTQLMASFSAVCLAVAVWAFGRSRPYIAFWVLGLLSAVIGPWRVLLPAFFVALGFGSLFAGKLRPALLKRNRGEEILLLGMLYPWVRFVLETLRADNEPSYLFGHLTISQSVGVFVFVGCLGVLVVRRLKGWGRLESEIHHKDATGTEIK